MNVVRGDNEDLSSVPHRPELAVAILDQEPGLRGAVEPRLTKAMNDPVLRRFTSGGNTVVVIVDRDDGMVGVFDVLDADRSARMTIADLLTWLADGR